MVFIKPNIKGSPLAKPVSIRIFLSCLWVTRESLIFIKLSVVGRVIIFSFIILSGKIFWGIARGLSPLKSHLQFL